MTFRDVAGLDTAKEELLEVVACLRDARRYARLNAKTPQRRPADWPARHGEDPAGCDSDWQLCIVSSALQSCA